MRAWRRDRKGAREFFDRIASNLRKVNHRCCLFVPDRRCYPSFSHSFARDAATYLVGEQVKRRRTNKTAFDNVNDNDDANTTATTTIFTATNNTKEKKQARAPSRSTLSGILGHRGNVFVQLLLACLTNFGFQPRARSMYRTQVGWGFGFVGVMKKRDDVCRVVSSLPASDTPHHAVCGSFDHRLIAIGLVVALHAEYSSVQDYRQITDVRFVAHAINWKNIKATARG